VLSSIFFSSFLACANEEFGWRGFALPKLQTNYHALYSSAILGVICGFWHFPLFFIQPERSAGISVLYIAPLFILICVFLSIIYMFIFNSTRGSVFLVTIFHTSMNTFNELYKSPSHDNDILAMYLLIFLLFLVSSFITIKYGYKNLAHNKITIDY
jgi:membrane protease YdiL (CAAX protease family)